MSITEMDVYEIQKKLGSIQGKKAWGVSVDFGSFLTIEFGEPVPNLRVPAKVHGEWHLWISYGAWRLEKREEVIVGSEDTHSQLDELVQVIEGHRLLSVTIQPPALETTFLFDQGISLRVFPVYTGEDWEHWLLYMPDGNVLSIGPGANWSCRSADLS